MANPSDTRSPKQFLSTMVAECRKLTRTRSASDLLRTLAHQRCATPCEESPGDSSEESEDQETTETSKNSNSKQPHDETQPPRHVEPPLKSASHRGGTRRRSLSYNFSSRSGSVISDTAAQKMRTKALFTAESQPPCPRHLNQRRSSAHSQTMSFSESTQEPSKSWNTVSNASASASASTPTGEEKDAKPTDSHSLSTVSLSGNAQEQAHPKNLKASDDESIVPVFAVDDSSSICTIGPESQQRQPSLKSLMRSTSTLGSSSQNSKSRSKRVQFGSVQTMQNEGVAIAAIEPEKEEEEQEQEQENDHISFSSSSTASSFYGRPRVIECEEPQDDESLISSVMDTSELTYCGLGSGARHSGDHHEPRFGFYSATATSSYYPRHYELTQQQASSRSFLSHTLSPDSFGSYCSFQGAPPPPHLGSEYYSTRTNNNNNNNNNNELKHSPGMRQPSYPWAPPPTNLNMRHVMFTRQPPAPGTDSSGYPPSFTAAPMMNTP